MRERHLAVVNPTPLLIAFKLGSLGMLQPFTAARIPGVDDGSGRSNEHIV